MLVRITIQIAILLLITPLSFAAQITPLAYHGTGEIGDIDESGNLVAIANGYGVDLLESGPAGFTLVSHIDFASLVGQVVINGTTLYVGVGHSGLHAVDITNPFAPVKAGYVSTTGGWRELEVTDNVIVGFTSANGWNIFLGDLTDPLYPVAADSISLDNFQNGFDLGDGHFYYVSSSDDLQTWSVADPYNAHRTNQYAVGNPRWTNVTVSGDLLWAIGDDLTAFSLANPAVPSVLSHLTPARLWSFATAWNGYLYSNAGDVRTNLTIHDYTIPTSPVIVDTLDNMLSFGMTVDMHAADGELLVANGTLLRRFDLANPDVPVENATYQSELVLDLAGTDGLIWVASSDAGLSLMDATIPASPQWLGPWPQSGSVTKVAVSGNRVALIDTSGVRVLDTSVPTDPVAVLSITTQARDVDLEGSILAYTSGQSLFVVDLANSASSVQVPMPGDAYTVELENGHAFVANPVDFVTNVDLGNPAAPVVIGAVPLPGMTNPFMEMFFITADQDLMVVGSFGEPNFIIDISLPTAPVFLSLAYVDLPFPADLTRGLALRGRWLLSGMGGSVHVIDLIDPLDPIDVTGQTIAPGVATTWANDRTPVTGGEGGTAVFGMDMAGLSDVVPTARRSFDLILAPNPSNPRVVISWNLPRPGHLTAQVFDLAGRRVAALLDEHRGEGPGSIPWSGLDSRGQSVPSGVYSVRLTSSGLTATRQFTLVK